MNPRSLSLFVASLLALFGGCAPERTGPTVTGDVSATRSQGSLVGTTGFHFEPYTDLPPVDAPNPVPGSFAGSCVVLGDANSAALRLEIVRNGAQDAGLRGIVFDSTFASQAATGSLTADVGGTSFGGTCTTTWRTSGDGAGRTLELQFDCAGMTASGLPDRLDVQASLSILGCAVSQ